MLQMNIKLGVIGIEMEVYTFLFTNQCTKGRCVQREKPKDPRQNSEVHQTGVFVNLIKYNQS